MVKKPQYMTAFETAGVLADIKLTTGRLSVKLRLIVVFAFFFKPKRKQKKLPRLNLCVRVF